MARSRILVAKRPIASSQPVQRHASTFANEAFASSSSRLNAHVLLGLSMLVLSANARPLDTPGQANNIGIGNLLSGTAAEWASSKGGLGEQIAESFLKLLHLNGATPEQPADDSLLEDFVRPGSPPAAEYPALADQPADLADQEGESPGIHENAHAFESFLSQNPAFSFALSVADLMHKMRELFVDIAVLEGEERGIFVGEQTKPDAELVANPHFDAPRVEDQPMSSALGLQLQPEVQVMSVLSSVEDDPPMFDLDDVEAETEMALPGQFTPVVKPAPLESSKRPQETVFQHLNPAVNPYAALALSSVLATLFVVGIVVGRHHYLASRADGGERNAEDEMERGARTSDDQAGGDEEKRVTVQTSTGLEEAPLIDFDEKAVLELDPASVSAQPTLNAEEAEAKEAMALLLDVANAALASASTSSITKATILDSPNVMPATLMGPIGTLKAVTSALDAVRTEVARTPQTRHLNLTMPRTRPSRPTILSSPPIRPHSAMDAPIVTVVPTPENNANDGITSRPDSPASAASSFVSAYSHMPKWSIGRAAGRKALGAGSNLTQQRMALPIPQYLDASHSISRAASPTPSAISGVASPALSFATAIEGPSAPVTMREVRPAFVSRLADSFHTPPSRPASPALPQPPGALMFHDGEETGDVGAVQTRQSILPPAQLTQTALELALMLPATEWIFQFIVVFIGWFGFWMRPMNSSATRNTRARRI